MDRPEDYICWKDLQLTERMDALAEEADKKNREETLEETAQRGGCLAHLIAADEEDPIKFEHRRYPAGGIGKPLIIRGAATLKKSTEECICQTCEG